MSKRIFWIPGLLAVILLMAPGAGFGQEKAPPQPPQAAAPGAQAVKEAIPDPKAIIQQSCEFLKKQPKFSFKAEVTNDRVYAGGKKLQFGMEVAAFFQRPDHLKIDGDGDLESKELVFDGKTLTLYDKYQNHYATIDVPGDIDGALDKAYKEYGLRVGLAELGSAKLCRHALERMAHALYVGRHVVRGVSCHHLAFDRKDRLFQLWIEVGDKPVLRKIVVTRKNEPGSPQWTAYLSDWNFAPAFAENLFTFVPPEGAQKIKFMPVHSSTTPAPKKVKPKKKGGAS